MQFKVGDRFRVITNPPKPWYDKFKESLEKDKFEFKITNIGTEEKDKLFFNCEGINGFYRGWICFQTNIQTAIAQEHIIWLTDPALSKQLNSARINLLELY